MQWAYFIGDNRFTYSQNPCVCSSDTSFQIKDATFLYYIEMQLPGFKLECTFLVCNIAFWTQNVVNIHNVLDRQDRQKDKV